MTKIIGKKRKANDSDSERQKEQKNSVKNDIIKSNDDTNVNQSVAWAYEQFTNDNSPVEPEDLTKIPLEKTPSPSPYKISF